MMVAGGRYLCEAAVEARRLGWDLACKRDARDEEETRLALLAAWAHRSPRQCAERLLLEEDDSSCRRLRWEALLEAASGAAEAGLAEVSALATVALVVRTASEDRALAEALGAALRELPGAPLARVLARLLAEVGAQNEPLQAGLCLLVRRVCRGALAAETKAALVQAGCARAIARLWSAARWAPMRVEALRALLDLMAAESSAAADLVVGCDALPTLLSRVFRDDDGDGGDGFESPEVEEEEEDFSSGSVGTAESRLECEVAARCLQKAATHGDEAVDAAVTALVKKTALSAVMRRLEARQPRAAQQLALMLLTTLLDLELAGGAGAGEDPAEAGPKKKEKKKAKERVPAPTAALEERKAQRAAAGAPAGTLLTPSAALFRSGHLARIVWLALHEHAALAKEAAACVAAFARTRGPVDWFLSFVEQGCVPLVALGAAHRRHRSPTAKPFRMILADLRRCALDAGRRSTEVLRATLASETGAAQLRLNVCTALLFLRPEASCLARSLAAALAREPALLAAVAGLVEMEPPAPPAAALQPLLLAGRPSLGEDDLLVATVESPRSHRRRKMDVPPRRVLANVSESFARLFDDDDVGPNSSLKKQQNKEEPNVVLLRGNYRAWEDVMVHVNSAATHRSEVRLDELRACSQARLLAIFELAREYGLATTADDAELALLDRLGRADQSDSSSNSSSLGDGATHDHAAIVAMLETALAHKAPRLATAAFWNAARRKLDRTALILITNFLHSWIDAAPESAAGGSSRSIGGSSRSLGALNASSRSIGANASARSLGKPG